MKLFNNSVFRTFETPDKETISSLEECLPFTSELALGRFAGYYVFFNNRLYIKMGRRAARETWTWGIVSRKEIARIATQTEIKSLIAFNWQEVA